MEELVFKKRIVTGKKVTALRKEGETPVICYGGGVEAMPYSVNTKDLAKAIASDSVVLKAGGEIVDKQVIVQQVDLHPVSRDLLHADFLFVDASEEVEHEVPVHFTGSAPGEKVHGGQMLIVLDNLTVRAFPQNIPSKVKVDVAALKTIGSRLTASDVDLPKGVTLVTSPSEIVVLISEQSQEDNEQTHETSMENIEVVGKGGKREQSNEE